MVCQGAQAVHDIVEGLIGRGALVEIVVQGLLEKTKSITGNGTMAKYTEDSRYRLTLK